MPGDNRGEYTRLGGTERRSLRKLSFKKICKY